MKARAGYILTFIILGVTALGGRHLAQASADANGSDRASASQFLGGFRSLPVMLLWSRAHDAGAREEWFELQTVFAAITELTPHNAAVARYQARALALDVAGRHSDSVQAWAWVMRGMEVLRDARQRMGGNAELDQGMYDIGFHAGRRFPVHFALEVAREEKNAETVSLLEKFQGEMDADPALRQFYETEGLSFDYGESAAFHALNDDAKQAVLHSDVARWQAIVRVAARGVNAPRGLTTGMVERLVFALQHVGQMISDKYEDNLARTAARNAIRQEIDRLNGLGQAARAREFEEHMNVLVGEWLNGAPGA